MPTIHEPTSFATEQIVRLANVGQDRCFAVSGYADFSDDDDVHDGHPLNSPLHGVGTGASVSVESLDNLSENFYSVHVTRFVTVRRAAASDRSCRDL